MAIAHWLFIRSLPALLAVMLALPSVAAEPPQISRSELLARVARGAVQRRDWTVALERFQEALDLDPRNAALHREYAGVLFQAGNARRALEEYDRILEQTPDDREAQDAAVDLCMAIHDFDAMLQRLLRYRPMREGEARFKLRLARAYLWTSQPIEATAIYADLVRESPDDRTLNAEYLTALLAAQKWDEFAARSEPFLAKWPDDETVRLFRVDALLLQDRVPEALALMKEMTADTAKAPAQALLRAADLRLTCGERAAAVAEWLENAARDRTLPEVRARLAILYAYDGAYHTAFDRLSAAQTEGAPPLLLATTRAEVLAIGQMPRTAAGEYARILQADPPDLRALKGAADNALALLKLDLAKSLLRRAVIQFPGDMDATYKYVRLLELRGEHAEGMSVLNAVIATRPNNPLARLLRGRLHLAAGATEPAAADLNVVARFLAERGVDGAVGSGLFPKPYFEIVPSFVWQAACDHVASAPSPAQNVAAGAAKLHEQLALALQREGRLAAAGEQWQALLDAHPQDQSCRLGLTEALLGQGVAGDAERRDRVQRELDDLVARPDLDRLGLSRLAEILARLGDWQRLLPIADRMLQGQPDDGYATALKVGALMGLGREFDARSEIFGFLSLKPVNRLSACALFSRLGYVGRGTDHDAYQTALKYLREMADQPPANPDLQQAVGQLAATHSDFDIGRQYLDQVLAADGSDAPALLWRARLEGWDRRYDAALAFYDQYQAANPTDPGVHIERARALGWALRYAQALDEYNTGINQLLARAPVDPGAGEIAQAAALERDAKAANWNGRERTAIALYDQLLTLRPYDSEALFERGQMATRLGFSKPAEDYYERALLLLDNRSLAHNFVQDALEYERTRRHATLIQSYDFRNEKGFSDLFAITEHLVTTAIWSPEMADMFWLGAEVQEGFYSFPAEPSVFSERLRFMARKRFDSGLQLDAWLRGAWYDRSDASTWNGALEARYKLGDRVESLLGVDRRDVVENFRTIDQTIVADRLRLALGGNLSSRWRLDTQGAFVHFEDDNDGLRANASLGYTILKYPRMLKIVGSMDYWNFQHDDRVYFSPKNYFQYGPMLHWRHYLMTNHYAGVNELYYGIKLPLGFDSNGELYYGGGVEFLWDITHHWQVGADANLTLSSPYKGYFGRAWVQYRF